MYRDSEQNDIREGRLLHLGYSVSWPSCLKSDHAATSTANFAAEHDRGRDQVDTLAHAVHHVPLVLRHHPGSVPVTLAGCSCHGTCTLEDVVDAGQLERKEEGTGLIASAFQLWGEPGAAAAGCTRAHQQKEGLGAAAAVGCKRPLGGSSIAHGSLEQPEGAKRRAGHGLYGSGGSAAMDTLGTSEKSAQTPAATAVVMDDGLPVTVVGAGGSGTSFSFPDLGTANLMLQLGHWLLLSGSTRGYGSAASCVGVPGGEAVCRKGQLLRETAGQYMGRLLGEMEAMMAMSMAAGTLMVEQDVGPESIEANDV